MNLIIILKKRSESLTKEQKLNILESLGKEKLMQCAVSKHPLLLFGEQTENMLKLIKLKQDVPTYELELQIKFSNPNYNYANCLVSNLLESEYVPVPIVKVFERGKKTSNRSIYVQLGDSLMLEETIKKREVKTIELEDDIFRYNFDLVLSEEIKGSDADKIEYGTDKAGNTEYQNRYTITNLSNFWRVDIIEFGNSKDLKEAKLAWEQKPRTRVEIEYAPASYTQDIIKWENKDAIDAILSEFGYNT